MLKSKTLGIGLLGAVAIAATIGFYVYSTAQPQTPSPDQQSSMVPQQNPGPPPIKLSNFKVTTTLPEAERTVGYKVNIPTQLPEGLSVKLVKVRPEEKWVHVFIAPIDLNDSMTLDDVMTAKGILFTIRPWEPTITPEEWMNNWVAQGSGKFLTVHGTKAVGNDSNPQGGVEAHVFWFDNGLEYIITADRPLDELVQLSNSVVSRPLTDRSVLKN